MQNIKKYFSIFENYKKEYGEELTYLDSAASSLTPDMVVKKMNEYYSNYRSNIDRAISRVAVRATNEYDAARGEMSRFLNCEADEIIWTPGATWSSNMLIDLILKHDSEHNFLNEGDEILTTTLEHHSSLIPLQYLAEEKKMKLRFINVKDDFTLDISNLHSLVNEKTRIVSIATASNVLGSINDIKNIISEIKSINKNVFVISDMTSAFGHVKLDLGELSKYIDAAYFSMHKAFGPTGVGVLFLKRSISREMDPVVLGGGIVSHVEKEKTSYRSDIKVFEAGTSKIAGVIGSGEAVRFLESIADKDFNKNILLHNQELVEYLVVKLKNINEANKGEILIKIFSRESKNNIGIVSFQTFINNKEVHPHDIAEVMSRYEISLRVGHHCAEPLMNELGTPSGLTRVSFHIYNSREDIDRLIEGIKKVKEIFGK